MRPTPTNISTKLEPLSAKKGTLGLAGHRPGHERLAGPGRADHEHAFRADRARLLVAFRVFQEVDDLHDLGLGTLVAGDVGEAGRRPLLVVELGLRPADAHDPAGSACGRGGRTR